MSWIERRIRAHGADRGIALVTVMLAVLVILGFTATVATVSVDNARNAHDDRQSGSALGAADAGVAQAINYIQGNGVSGLTCPEATQSACTTQSAGYPSPVNPRQIDLGSTGTGCTSTPMNCAKVYVTTVIPFNPPAVTAGTYAIHSKGYYGSGPGIRNIVVTIKVAPDTFPIGVFGQTVSGGGGTAVYTESVFTQGCVNTLDDTGNLHGNGLSFTGTDSYWGIPAAAHSTVGLSMGNNSTCASGDPKRVPPGPGSPATTASNSNCPNNVNLNYDQSPSGGLVSSTLGSQCYHSYLKADGTYYPSGTCPTGVTSTRSDGLCDTTGFTLADLQRYGYRPRGLSDSQYAALKSRAQSLGTYNLPVSSISAALTAAQNAGTLDPVIYWDCNAGSACSGGGMTMKASDFPASFRVAPSGATCASQLGVVTIVVEHGNLTFVGGNGNNPYLDAAVFVPDGTYDGSGGVNLYGTLFSNNLKLGGNQSFTLDPCWVTSFPGATLVVTVGTFREDDAADLQ